VSKNLNNLDTSITDVESLRKVIDAKREELQADQRNVFVHIKEVFDELKKYKKGNNANGTKQVLKKGESDIIRCNNVNANPSESDKNTLDINIAVVETKIKNKDDKLSDNKEKITNDNGEVNSNEIDEVLMVEPPKVKNKENEKVKSTTNSIQVGAKLSEEVETAAIKTVEKLVTATAKKVSLEESGKRKIEQDNSTEGQSVRKKICLTTISDKVPEKKNEDPGNNEKPLDANVVGVVEVEKDKSSDASGDVAQASTSSQSDSKEKSGKKVSEKHIKN